jgi:hypothetical protein
MLRAMRGLLFVCVAIAGCAEGRTDSPDAPGGGGADAPTSTQNPDAPEQQMVDAPPVAGPDAMVDAVPDATVPVGCEPFAIGDSTVIPGWTERGGDWLVEGQRARHTANGGVYTNVMTRDGSLIGDGCVRANAIYGTGPANVQAIGIVLRWNAPNTYVVALVQDNSFVGQFDRIWIYEYPGGGQIGSLPGAYGLSPAIEMCAAGATVTLRVDSAGDGTYETTHSATTSVTAPGQYGVMMHTFGNPAFVDDVCLVP